MASVELEKVLSDPLCRKLYPTGLNEGIVQIAVRFFDIGEGDLEKFKADDVEKLLGLLAVSDEEKNALEVYQARSAKEAQDAKDAKSGKKESPVKTARSRIKQADMASKRVAITISNDGMEGWLELHRLEGDDRPPTREEMEEALKGAGIVYGVKEEYVTRLTERPVYSHPFKIAVGLKPVPGKDGTVRFLFTTEKDLSPRVMGNGAVDYRTLDYVDNVKKGDRLCEIIPALPGTEGIDVRGRKVPTAEGRQMEVKAGPNTVYDGEDHCIYAACDGQVILRDNRVIVSRLLQLPQVDTSTGNILFTGTVQVEGDVGDGFTIHAGGDIIVKGTVEGARLFATGNIILYKGMKGMERGVLDCRGNIRAFFVENARLKAGNNIYANVLLNCDVEAENSVHLNGKDGYLLGGQCTARNTITARQLGNVTQVQTRVIINKDLGGAKKKSVTDEVNELKEAVDRLGKLVSGQNRSQRKEAAFQLIFIHVIIARAYLAARMEMLEGNQDDDDAGLARGISVKVKMFPNVIVIIDGVIFRNDQDRQNCKMMRDKDQIRMLSG